MSKNIEIKVNFRVFVILLTAFLMTTSGLWKWQELRLIKSETALELHADINTRLFRLSDIDHKFIELIRKTYIEKKLISDDLASKISQNRNLANIISSEIETLERKLAEQEKRKPRALNKLESNYYSSRY